MSSELQTRLREPAPIGWGWTRLVFWSTVAAAISAVLLFFVTQAMKVAEKPSGNLEQWIPWLLILTLVGGLATAAGKFGELREKKVKAQREWQAKVGGLLAEPPRNGRLPIVKDVSDTALGVTPTRHTREGSAPYIGRSNADAALHQSLNGAAPIYPFVIVYGDSKAGKSHTAAEAVRLHFAESEILVPASAEALGGLVTLDPPVPLRSKPAVLWLDDLTPSHLGQLTNTALSRLRESVVVVGTMTSQRYNDIIRTGSEVSAVGRIALRNATCIRLDFNLTDDERSESRKHYPDDNIEASIGESLVGGEELLAKFDAGRSDSPAGLAIVQAAVDFRRAGLTRKVKTEELFRLFPHYAHRINAGLTLDRSSFDNGLKWATAPVASQVALLRRASATADAEWDILDYVVAAESGQRGHQVRPIARFAWPELLDLAKPEEMLSVGSVAYYSSEPKCAEEAFRKAKDHAGSIAAASFNLGILLAEQGYVDAAMQEYRAAIDSGDDEYSLMALQNLGVLFSGQGDNESAANIYREVIASGHFNQATRATVNLGSVLAQEGDLEGARKLLEEAIENGHHEHLAIALFNLSVVLSDLGDSEGSEKSLRRVLSLQDPQQSPIAAYNLGVMLAQQGRMDEAFLVLEELASAGHPKQSPRAKLEIGLLHARVGRFNDARAIFEDIAATASDPVLAAQAASNIAAFLAERGEFGEARELLHALRDSGHESIQSTVSLHFALICRDTGDLDGARSGLEAVVELGNSQVWAKAAVALAMILYKLSEADEALLLLQDVVESKDREYAPFARCKQGDYLAELDQPHLAALAYEAAISTKHREYSPEAALSLAMLYVNHGLKEESRLAFLVAIEFGHPEYSAGAAYNLGCLLGNQGLVQEAREAFELAITFNHPKVSANSALAIKQLAGLG
ncbi:tetratricopeptide repeat protein [Lentzea sp. NPDC034063]|uniref:tetratricopeptide repeat protein n=1 Tax=unclassified Lentzea TaxID=2643253 RepID=UPI0033EDCDE5